MEIETSLDAFARHTRRAYELGRFRWALSRASIVTVALAAIVVATQGVPALVWLPVPWLAWVLVAYRGGALLGGAWRGLAGGGVSLLVPLSVLRPCCAAGCAGDSCCAAPSLCIAVGVLVGGAFALSLPRVSGARRFEAALGLVLGVASVGTLRCEALVVGEALGLFGGVIAGLSALALARAALERRTA